MKRLNIFFLTLTAFTCHCTGEKNKTADSESKSYPNIIYILADDLGYGDLQSLNPESYIPTPNMDRIVREGVHFTDAHSGSAVSTPTRYGILTGRYAFRTTLKQGVLWGYSSSLIEPGRTTVASFLKENGYHTACIGKWHLGLDWAKRDPLVELIANPDPKILSESYDDNVDYTKPVKGGPADHGFDYSLIIPASLDMSPYCYVRNDRVVNAPTGYTVGKSQEKDGRGVFWRPGRMSPDFDFDQVMPLFVDSACQYIINHANKYYPFFLYLALPAPHTPWLPLDEHQGRSKAGKYGDFVSMTDDMVGKILDVLDKLNLNSNTLLIFTSDNGSDWRPSDIEEFGHRANYIYKGRKADIYEAGHRIPFIARWEDVIPAGHISDEIMCTTDLLATLAGVLNKSLPESVAEDSYNLWPAFTGKHDNPIRDVTIHHSLDGFYSIRKGKWKYTPHLGSGGFSAPKLVIPEQGQSPGTLYDLENDPQEQNNLYENYPEIVDELRMILEKYI